MVEESLAERYHEQEMRCPMHLCIGQEAIAAGVSSSLLKAIMYLAGTEHTGTIWRKVAISGACLQSYMAGILDAALVAEAPCTLLIQK